MKHNHIDPDDAVKIHEDIDSQRSIGVHWGTFARANEVRTVFSSDEIEIKILTPFGGAGVIAALPGASSQTEGMPRKAGNIERQILHDETRRDSSDQGTALQC